MTGRGSGRGREEGDKDEGEWWKKHILGRNTNISHYLIVFLIIQINCVSILRVVTYLKFMTSCLLDIDQIAFLEMFLPLKEVCWHTAFQKV